MVYDHPMLAALCYLGVGCVCPPLLLLVWVLVYAFLYCPDRLDPNETALASHWGYAVTSPFRSLVLGALATALLVMIPCTIASIPVALLLRAGGNQWNPWWLFGPDGDVGVQATVLAGMGTFWLADSTYGLFVALTNRHARFTHTGVTVLPHMFSLALCCLVVVQVFNNPPWEWGGSSFIHRPTPRFTPRR